MINLPLTIEKDVFYDTKTTCFTLKKRTKIYRTVMWKQPCLTSYLM